MTYDENDILRHVGARSLEAGRAYHRQGRVVHYENGGTAIVAKVRGGRPRAYAQDIDISGSDAGKAKIRSDCSCPMGAACKHVAALLEGIARRTPTPAGKRTSPAVSAPHPATGKPPEPELPAPLASWLSGLEEARRRESEDPSKGQQQQIVYLLAPQRRDAGVPRLAIDLKSARLLKDGSCTPNPNSYGWRAAIAPWSNGPAKFVRPSDIRIFRKLMMAIGQNELSSHTPFSEEGALELLEEILATGRAHWLEAKGPALSLGPARPGRIVWEGGGAGAELVLRLDAGEGLVALNGAPPFYVDVAAGLIGPIDLGVTPKLAFRLVCAPAAPVEHVALLAERMAQKFPDLAQLAPPPPAPPTVVAEPPRPRLRLFRAHLPIETAPNHDHYGWGRPTEPAGLARVVFRYGPLAIDANEAQQRLTRFHEGGLVEVRRDRRREAEALRILRANGFVEAPKMRPRPTAACAGLPARRRERVRLARCALSRCAAAS